MKGSSSQVSHKEEEKEGKDRCIGSNRHLMRKFQRSQRSFFAKLGNLEQRKVLITIEI